MPDGRSVQITARAVGVERAETPLKAVVFAEAERQIKVLTEVDLTQDHFELNIPIAPKDWPERVSMVVVPRDVIALSQIKRLGQAANAPRVEISRDLVITRKGEILADDLPLKPVDDILLGWYFKQKVCGRVVRRDPVTGDVCGVPGATVRILDVDFHFWWFYPYPNLPWAWIYPFWPSREEIATTVTDECGYFCVWIPRFDIDAILRWRLRFRCVADILPWPRVLDAVELGVRPDDRFRPELEHLPELAPKPAPRPPIPPPGPLFPEERLREAVPQMAIAPGRGAKVEGSCPLAKTPQASDFLTEPRFEAVRRELFGKGSMFDPVEPVEQTVLEQRAFPAPVKPPPLPDEETMLKSVRDKRMIPAIRATRPLFRLIRCWAEYIPEWQLILDVPDIVFKVEQDIDGDGNLETIYDQGFLDVNWNLSEPTTNVIIEAQPNAICVPCGPAYKPCTKTGIVGVTDLPVDPTYLAPSGYAVTVNRPKPNGARPSAETPFCRNLRLVGCPGYGTADYYKMFYHHDSQPATEETEFRESWSVYQISTTTTKRVSPDDDGFYQVLTPANDFFPYHTLMLWRTRNYPDGTYTVRLELFDNLKNPIGPGLDKVNLEIDNSSPSIVNFLDLQWRLPHGGWTSVPLHCPIIPRPAGQDIQLRVRYNAVATHLRDVVLRFDGCDGQVGDTSYWHHSVADNNVLDWWTVDLPSGKHEGSYRFVLRARSRAYNGGGGIGSSWKFDPLHIERPKSLYVVILDS